MLQRALGEDSSLFSAFRLETYSQLTDGRPGFHDEHNVVRYLAGGDLCCSQYRKLIGETMLAAPSGART